MQLPEHRYLQFQPVNKTTSKLRTDKRLPNDQEDARDDDQPEFPSSHELADIDEQLRGPRKVLNVQVNKYFDKSRDDTRDQEYHDRNRDDDDQKRISKR